MKSTSSYAKVYEKIYATYDCVQWRAEIKRRLQAASIVDVAFTMNRPEEFGRPATATPRFIYTTTGNNSHTENGSVYFDISDHKFADALAKRVFGTKDIPTFNCNKDVIFGDKRKKDVDSFSQWFYDKTSDEFRDDIHEARERIRSQYQEWVVSDEVAERKKQFILDQAVYDIKMALSAYEHLGKEVLKEALDSYIVHSITES
jgi:hypothetical protein